MNGFVDCNNIFVKFQRSQNGKCVMSGKFSKRGFFSINIFFVSVSNEWKSTWLSFLVRNKAKKCFRIYVQQV